MNVMRTSLAIFVSVFVSFALLLGRANASHLPRWELGAGIITLHVPFYRGSNDGKNYVVPYPHFVYRGKRLEADRDGVRGRLFQSDRLDLRLNLSGNLPVPKGTNQARQGMLGLRPVVELGPNLWITLWKSKTGDDVFWFKIPVSGVASLGGSPWIEYQGYVIAPYFQYAVNIRPVLNKWKFKFSFGPIFADQKYHDYFYKVDSLYRTDTRQAYRPGSGFSGSRITFYLERVSKRYSASLFFRYDNLSFAEFENSPLVETKNYLLGGFRLTWIMIASRRASRH